MNLQRIKKPLVISGGILSIIFGIFHLTFWKIFQWPESLSCLSQINSNIMQMLNFGLSIMFLSFAYILLVCHKAIINTTLGKALLYYLSVFYATRLALEFILPGGSLIMGVLISFVTLLYFIPAIIPNYDSSHINE